MITYLENILTKKETIKNTLNFKSRIRKFCIVNELVHHSNPSFYNYATKQKRLDVITLLCRCVFIEKHETLSITKKICSNNFGISENSVTAIINTLSVQKRIITSRKIHDRRELLIEPTDKGLEEMFLFFIRASYFEVKKTRLDGFRENINEISHYSELYKFFSNFSSHLILGYSITFFVPFSEIFLNRVGGRIIMIHLYNEVYNFTNGKYKTNCTHTSLETKLKISRPQINRILFSAEKNKLLSIDRFGYIELNNNFIALIENYFAVLITLNGQHSCSEFESKVI